MPAGDQILSSDGDIRLDAAGDELVASDEGCTPACSCENCYYLATLCPCEDDEPSLPPEVLVDCASVEAANPGTTPGSEPGSGGGGFVAQLNVESGGSSVGCYTIGGRWEPPVGNDPITMPIGIIESVVPSCAACCNDPKPLPCYARPRYCFIQGHPDCGIDGAPQGFLVYIGMQGKDGCPPIPSRVWKYQNQCLGIGPGSSITNEVPPGTVVIAAPDQYPTCAACCGSDDPPCQDCADCPNAMTVTCAEQDIEASLPNGNCVAGPYIHIDQIICPVIRGAGNSCVWQGQVSAHFTFFDEDGTVLDEWDELVQAGITCIWSPGFPRRWRASVYGIHGQSPTLDSPCPPPGQYPCLPNAGSCPAGQGCNVPQFVTVG